MSSRILLKTKNQIILDEGEGYRLRATTIIAGAFAIVVIDWEHPNWGYFADGMLCFKSLHLPNWEDIPVANWCWKYKSKKGDWNSEFLVDKFLKDYPELKEFFNLEVNIWDNFTFTEIIKSSNTKWEDVSKFEFEFTEDMLEIILGKIKGIKKHGKQWLYTFDKLKIICQDLGNNWVMVSKIRKLE